MKLSELLANFEAVLAFFAGLDPNHEVRFAQQPGAVELVVEPPKAELTPAEVPAAPVEAPETTETAPDEQKEGE